MTAHVIFNNKKNNKNMNKKIQFEIKIEENLGTIYTMPIWEAHGMFKAPDELDEAIETISKDMKKIILDYLEK